MTRLEKKCFVASASVHGALFLLLVAAPLIWVSKPSQVVLLPVMTLLPARIVDGASGGGGSPDAKKLVLPPAPPAKAPELVNTPPPSKPEPVVPKAEPKVTRAEPEAAPKLRNKAAEPVPTEKKPKKPKVEETDDAEEVTVGKKKIRLELNREKVSEKADGDARAQALAAARSAQAQRSARLSQIIGNIDRNSAGGTTIEIPGPGGEAFIDYGQAVQLAYKREWSPPPELADDMATVEATVIIRRDGTVESFIVTRHSRHTALDKSVSRLERVRKMPPFPDGASEQRRTFIIEFNLRSLKSP